MEKLEYGDLYKFVVSIGITLWIAAVAILWLFLSTPFDLNSTISQLQQLPEESRSIIVKRLQYVGIVLDYLPCVVVVLIVAGLMMIIWGINKWARKQKNIDAADETSLKILENQLRKQTGEEKNKEVVDDFKSTQPSTEKPTTNQVNYIEDYFKLERKFEEKFRLFLVDSYKIFSNYKLGSTQFDFILANRKNPREDYILEVKYFPQGYQKKILQEAILKLEDSTKLYMDYSRRFAQPILVVVTKSDEFSVKEVAELDQFSSQNLKHFTRMKIWSVPYDEIDKLDSEDFQKMLKHTP